ncbi:DUF6963 family protein [Marinimicrococcus flavescens]|uniref:Uncharacterized protein n=1 Tax=Marinimicrococcus flavescens TaxID=3031815 RepID=A0AAP3XQG6_9PROT|nr:hypothetical protein [Marinimicrococcus flavescens]
MTMGIGARGPRAGAAICAALAAVERVASGEIGGFAVLAALAGGEEVVRLETQRMGLAGALANAYPETRRRFEAASVAALITSGPDRPVPLAQFLPGSSRALVTGHRLPNIAGADGRPMNQRLLERLDAGIEPAAALDELLRAEPESDAGFIVVTPARLVAGNTGRVRRRPDARLAQRASLLLDAEVAVLHNAIRPAECLAGLAAAVALEAMETAAEARPMLDLVAGTAIEAAAEDAVEIDAQRRIRRILSANPALPLAERWTGAAVYPGSLVLLDGKCIGRTIGEAWALVGGGRVRAVRDAGHGRISFELLP